VANESSGSRIGAKQVIIGILILVVVILAIANSGRVEVDFVFHSFEMRLFLVIVGSALIGFLIGWFMGRNRNN